MKGSLWEECTEAGLSPLLPSDVLFNRPAGHSSWKLATRLLCAGNAQSNLMLHPPGWASSCQAREESLSGDFVSLFTFVQLLRSLLAMRPECEPDYWSLTTPAIIHPFIVHPPISPSTYLPPIHPSIIHPPTLLSTTCPSIHHPHPLSTYPPPTPLSIIHPPTHLSLLSINHPSIHLFIHYFSTHSFVP